MRKIILALGAAERTDHEVDRDEHRLEHDVEQEDVARREDERHERRRHEREREIVPQLLDVVEEVGADVTGLRVGQFVVGGFLYSDNTCPVCRKGAHAN